MQRSDKRQCNNMFETGRSIRDLNSHLMNYFQTIIIINPKFPGVSISTFVSTVINPNKTRTL